MEKVQIEIPKAPEKDIVYIPKGDLGDFKKSIDNRFEKIDNLMLGIVASVVVAVIGVLVAVIGIFIDQLRYNNAAYKEYSDKTLNVDALQKQISSLEGQNAQQQEQIKLIQKTVVN